MTKLKTISVLCFAGFIGILPLAAQQTKEVSTLSGRSVFTIPTGWSLTTRGSDPLTASIPSEALIIGNSEATLGIAADKMSDLPGLQETPNFNGAFLYHVVLPSAFIGMFGGNKDALMESFTSMFKDKGDKAVEQYSLGGLNGNRFRMSKNGITIGIVILFDTDNNIIIDIIAYSKQFSEEMGKIIRSFRYTSYSISDILNKNALEMPLEIPGGKLKVFLPRGFWAVAKGNFLLAGSDLSWIATFQTEKSISMRGIGMIEMSYADPDGKLAEFLKKDGTDKAELKAIMTGLGFSMAISNIDDLRKWRNPQALAGLVMDVSSGENAAQNIFFRIYLIEHNGEMAVIIFIMEKGKQGDFSPLMEKIAATLEPVEK